MSLPRTMMRLALAGGASLLLIGCVSLFPKGQDAQLYTFGGPAAAAGTTDTTTSAMVVARGPIEFDSAAASDRILTIDGAGGAAYIEASRWVSPAPVLFEEALDRAFQRTKGAPRLVERGNLVRAPLLLTLDVQAFEARYDHGADAAPTVQVSVRAVLIRTGDRTVVGDTMLTVAKPASDNRVGAIVQAYDGAVQDLLAQLITWTSNAKT